MTQMNIKEGISSDWNCNFVVLEMKKGRNNHKLDVEEQRSK
jgi:hypothetical protein